MIAAPFKATALFVGSRNRILLLICGAFYLAMYVCSESLMADATRPYVAQAFAFLKAAPFFVPTALFVSSVSAVTLELVARRVTFLVTFSRCPSRRARWCCPSWSMPCCWPHCYGG